MKKNLLLTLLILPKTKNLNRLHHVTLKINLTKTRMEQSVQFNSFQKFKAKASLLILCQYFRYFLKKVFSENPVKMDMGIYFYLLQLVKLNFQSFNLLRFFKITVL